MRNGGTVETKHSLAAGDHTRVRLALCMQTSPISVISYFWHEYIYIGVRGPLGGVCRTAEQRGAS